MTTPTYNHLIDTMPHGLDRAVLRVLSYHVGRDSAVKKVTFLGKLRLMGFLAQERQFRKMVQELRKRGHLICSGNVGYWMAQDAAEVIEFTNREITPRIADLSETQRIMRQAARDRWGEGVQVRLL